MKYKHKKTGTIYRQIARGIDCTNSRDGTVVVIYCKDGDDAKIFVREAIEFDKKFDAMD